MIAIVNYGLGNLASVQNAFKKLGLETILTDKKEELEKATHIVLPGVGAFNDAEKELKQKNLDSILIELANKGKYILGICLGMQLLLTKSFEGGEHFGLNLIKGECRKFQGELKIPQIGWNNIEFDEKSPLFEGIAQNSYFYFVHSYYANLEDKTNELCKTFYGKEYSSGISNGKNVFGLQFHPEKSGDVGLKILRNFGGLKWNYFQQ